MGTVFWDARGIILNNFLEKGRMITGQYYVFLLDRLNEEVKKKRPHLTKKKVVFRQDNAPAHSSAIVRAKLFELRYEILPHPPYSPDLAPSDYYLFPNLKKWHAGKIYTNDEVTVKTSVYFEDFDKSYYNDGIEMLAVSYTHLDVYKRQVQFFPVHF